ncbi:MAG: hypothetical protein HY774_04430 [Acidobacteria bacterium]|nr:hypothetical protein [Acidobacteriota bacterium]
MIPLLKFHKPLYQILFILLFSSALQPTPAYAGVGTFSESHSLISPVLQQNQDRLTVEEKRAYDKGYGLGRDDYRVNRNPDYQRHRREFTPRYETIFSEGYSDGYEAQRDKESGYTNSQGDAYENGFKRGKQDYRVNNKSDYRRYRDEYSSQTETYFKQGYERGYAAERDRGGSMNDTQRSYYDFGYKKGREDAQSRASRNADRYLREYDNKFEPFFKKGYEDGYNRVGGGSGSPLPTDERRTYDLGYQRGREDYQANRSRNYERYSSEYNRKYESSFRQGYEAGFKGTSSDNTGGYSGTERTHYENGFERGKDDYKAGRTRDYRRYNRDYERRYEEAYRRGYESGYDQAARNDEPFKTREREVYLQGVEIGKTDFRTGRTKDFRRHNREYDRQYEEYFKRGYEEGYDKEASKTGGVTTNDQSMYNRGYGYGQSDFRAGRGKDFRRYRNDYDSRFESSFKRGYEEGYEAESRNTTSGPTERQAYDRGYQRGQQDLRNNMSRLYTRYSREYDSRTEESFKRGYSDGYNSRTRDDDDDDGRFQVPSDQVQTPTVKSAYDDGHKIGKQDRKDGLSLDYRRHRTRYDSRSESEFRRGYEDGYNKVPKGQGKKRDERKK